MELDAQLTGTGEVAVLHDESLGRTTGFAGLIGETPWSKIRTLDAGSRKAARWAGERVPLLAQVLSETPPSLLLNIELKCAHADDRGLTAAVVQVIGEGRAQDRVLLSSFNPFCLWRARALAPHLPRALLFEGGAAWPLRHALAAPIAHALHPEASLATDEQVARWRARGYTVAAWTVDDPAVAAQLWASGVSGLITNDPAALLAQFGS